ncbi:MAG: hypothetical protein AAGC99_18275 [Pseudomonadota bacterium]
MARYRMATMALVLLAGCAPKPNAAPETNTGVEGVDGFLRGGWQSITTIFTQADPALLKGPDRPVDELLPGQTVYFRNADKNQVFLAYYDPAGVATYDFGRGQVGQIQWRIDGGEYCERAKMEICYRFRRESNGRYFLNAADTKLEVLKSDPGDSTDVASTYASLQEKTATNGSMGLFLAGALADSQTAPPPPARD